MTATAVATYTSSSVAHTINAYCTSQYSSTSAWNSAPTNLAGPEAVNFTTTSTAPNQTVSINVASWVQTDLDAYGWQFSLGLINADETDTNQYVSFAAYPPLALDDISAHNSSGKCLTLKTDFGLPYWLGWSNDSNCRRS